MTKVAFAITELVILAEGQLMGKFKRQQENTFSEVASPLVKMPTKDTTAGAGSAR